MSLICGENGQHFIRHLTLPLPQIQSLWEFRFPGNVNEPKPPGPPLEGDLNGTNSSLSWSKDKWEGQPCWTRFLSLQSPTKPATSSATGTGHREWVDACPCPPIQGNTGKGQVPLGRRPQPQPLWHKSLAWVGPPPPQGYSLLDLREAPPWSASHPLWV